MSKTSETRLTGSARNPRRSERGQAAVAPLDFSSRTHTGTGRPGTGVDRKAAPVPGCQMKKFRRPLNELNSEVLDCVYGHYPWDDWEKDALAAGVPRGLAGLGRLTVREAYQHGWDDRLKSLCGWYDRGGRMIRLALRSPKTAATRWQRLLDTDGLRGEHDEKTGEWKSYY